MTLESRKPEKPFDAIQGLEAWARWAELKLLEKTKTEEVGI